MGAKTSLFDAPGRASILPSPTLENIKAAYEDERVAVARELVQQACCLECSAGTPRVPGVSPRPSHSFLQAFRQTCPSCPARAQKT